MSRLLFKKDIIEDLIQAVNEKYGSEPYDDKFPPIAEGQISQATIAGLWKSPEARKYAHVSTLDILARYVGYESFVSLCDIKINSRKVHKASDGTIFTLFNKHQDILEQVIDAFTECGYITRVADTSILRWIKSPWRRQEFACWITEICYLVEADKEESYNLIKNGTFCEVSARTFIASFRGLPSDITDDNLREAVSQYRKQITHIHKTDLSQKYTCDELYRLSVRELIEKDINEWNEYDRNGEVRKKHSLKKHLFLPIILTASKFQKL